MLNKLKDLINKRDAINFKYFFEKSLVNHHHRVLLYELSFRNQTEDIYSFLENRTPLDDNKRLDILIKAIDDKAKFRSISVLNKFDDFKLSQNFKTSTIEFLITEQNKDFVKDFIEKYPITLFVHFKKILFYNFKNENIEAINYLITKEMDKNLVFYSGMCALVFNKTDKFSELLDNTIKHNKNILNEVRVLKNEYSSRPNMAVREEFEAFINIELINAFAKQLDKELEAKKPIFDMPRAKKLKI